MAPMVSIVITVLNVQKTLRQCIDSLLAMDYPKNEYEIVIVDGYSTDQTASIVKEYQETHEIPKILFFQERGYIGAGRNRGIREANGDFIAVTDGDMIVSEGWLRELMAGFTDGKIAGVGGPNNNAEIGLLTLCISCLDVHGPSTDVVPLTGKNRWNEPYDTSTDIYATVCRNSCYRKEVLEEIGGFNEDLVATEDPELNQRILKAGHCLAYNPLALVKHHHRSSLKGFFRQQSHYAVGQAVANSHHREMFRMVQVMPSIALIGFFLFLAMLALIPIFQFLWFLVPAGIVFYIMFFIAYGVRCGVEKREMKLSLLMPIVTFVWHLAWAIGYVRGIGVRRRIKSGRGPGAIESHA